MTKDNPPAFPEVPGDFNAYEGRPGMSLRDWFAGQVAGAVLQTATGIKVAAKIIAKDAGHE